jgi:hypothetical protein
MKVHEGHRLSQGTPSHEQNEFDLNVLGLLILNRVRRHVDG